MTARGKNMCFLASMAAALQLDRLPSDHTWADVKRAVTPEGVRAVHEAVLHYWPDMADLQRLLLQESQTSSGLYIGTYHPGSLARTLVRHSLYSDAILIVDPFIYPPLVRDQFNPLQHPEQHISSTLIALRIWWQLAPWIDAGIVRMIRVPGDFDPALMLDSIERSRRRAEANPELAGLAREEADRWRETSPDWASYRMLIEPDWWLEESFRKHKPDATDQEVESMLREMAKRRRDHPFYFELAANPGRSGQFLVMSTGTNLTMAERVAAITRSHFITDIRYRWREIELSRAAEHIDSREWTAFAKAFGGLRLKVLDKVSLEDALRIRRSGRLAHLRAFLRNIWNKVNSGDVFSSERVEDLAAQLIQHAEEAETEWKEIDEDLLKWAGAEIVGILASGAVGGASPGWLASSVAVAGSFEIGRALHKRRRFEIRYPGAFFLESHHQ
jgi:hypothetical protein